MSKLRVIFSSTGKPESVYLNRRSESSPMWASLPFDAQTKELKPESELDSLLVAEVQSTEWAALDLSDRPPTPSILPPNFSAFARAVRSSTLWRNKIRRTLQQAAFVELVGEMNAIAMMGPSSERIQALLGLWNEVVIALAVGVTIATADIAFLNDTAASNRVPLTFAANGTASIKS